MVSKSQSKDVQEDLGILIFPKTDSIPQDVLFIKLDTVENFSLKDLIKKGLEQNNYKIPFIYFQGIRWRMKDLANEIRLSYQDTCIFIGNDIFKNNNIVQVVLGNISFKKNHVGILWPNPTQEVVQLIYNDEVFNFLVYEAQTSVIGYPVFYRSQK
ncbi:MAG: hypothetical protein J0L56_03280 [Chitinophagales bacterium]|nr:hypothetical protein [Chitinophagales bacterium]